MPQGIYLRTEKHKINWFKKGQEVPNRGRKTVKLWQNPEYKKMMSEAHKGYKLSEEHKRKIGKSGIGRITTLETRKKISEAKKGEKSHFWKGGISPINIRIRKSFEYKQWAKDVKERDDFRCFNCGQRGGILHSDHIYRFSKYPRLRFEILNGQTLCQQCHLQKTIFDYIGKMELNSPISL